MLKYTYTYLADSGMLSIEESSLYMQDNIDSLVLQSHEEFPINIKERFKILE